MIRALIAGYQLIKKYCGLAYDWSAHEADHPYILKPTESILFIYFIAVGGTKFGSYR